MHLKSDSRGITLVELIIAISLMTIVLFSGYFFLSLSTRSLNDTEAQFDAGQDARMAVINMEDDIRKAQAVNIGGINYRAAKVMDAGMSLNVYTDVNSDGNMQLVQYKLEDNQLKRGEAALGFTPSTWFTIADKVENAMIATPTPIFTISGKVIKINLLVLDEKDQLLDNPISVKTSITVRSKGAMN